MRVWLYQDDLHQIHNKEPSLSGSILKHHCDGEEVGVVEVQHVARLDEAVGVGEGEAGLLDALQTQGQAPQQEEGPDSFPRLLNLAAR